jgi:CRISPR-associated endonuclease Csn1
MKTILGLDLGTNSIGWTLIQHDEKERLGNIIAAGSRILPMSQDVMGKFDSGISISQTAERTGYRGVRRLRERHLLRRERLHRVLYILGFLPEHYAKQIDFAKRLGQFLPETEPKLPYIVNEETNKSDFIFKKSFEQMLDEFARYQPQLLKDGKKIPYDWTIYYLRKKALAQKIEKEELAWLLLNFNQKRGYYQLRGEEEEENPDKRVEFFVSEIVEVTADEPQKGKDEVWYNVVLNNGWIYRRASKISLTDWIGKTKEFIVTTDLNEDKTIKKDKDGKEKRSFKAVNSDEDWIAIKKSTEERIDKSNKTVGEYIYDTLLENPDQKIKGKLVRVIERKFYKAELGQILKTQQGFHDELKDSSLYQLCLEELYENNEAHRNANLKKDFFNLFLNDIIFYQRPLKSKISLISNCKFESRTYVKDGKKEIVPLKCIAKSHPLFQEFRLWQWLQNLRIYKRDEAEGIDVTSDFLTTNEDWVNLFFWLNDRKEIDQKALFGYKPFNLKKGDVEYRWNYVEDKSYPCNETRALMLSRIKSASIPKEFLTPENEEELWHILYSVEDKIDIEKALKTFARKKGLSNDFVEGFKKTPPFKKEYGSYSAKAIKKLLPFMRRGKYWDAEEAVESIELYRQNIRKVILTLKNKKDKEDATGDFGNKVNSKLLNKLESLLNADVYSFEGLDHYLVSYIVYGRHSEDGDAKSWNTPDKIKLIEQHSLRNPIVEQVINETLQVVRDIWKKHGKSEESFFSEIHIELGREMKNPADKRKSMTAQITKNENTNMRIKLLLAELLNDREVENVRPYSPMQQEILKLYEEGALNAEDGNIPDFVSEVIKSKQPTSSQLVRYKLWLQQKYKSPYTGRSIPLGKLFTTEYEIEHIIPQSRYFDDSLSNKVICERDVNTDKGNSTAYEYIKNNPGGKEVQLSNGKLPVKTLTVEQYEDFVKSHFSKNRGKMQRLLMDEIPESFIQRQLNDSRYISKVVKNLMSNIVREEGENEAISKNVVAITGAITSRMKQDWGLNNVWNDIITPRFERMNTLPGAGFFGEWTNKEGKRVFQTQVPIDKQKGFDKKRIDHRHHALDAIVIACITKEHVNYLNSINSERKNYGLVSRLREMEEIIIDGTLRKVPKNFKKPWGTFTQDTKNILLNTVASFKQNLRVINKSVNHYQTWNKDEDGKLIKQLVKQTKGDSWAVRKPMHKDTVSGLVQLKFKKIVSLSSALDNWTLITHKAFRKYIQELLIEKYDKKKILKIFKEKENKWNGLDVSRLEIFYWDRENVASRVKVDESFSSAKIETITDTGIQKIMLKHLHNYTTTIDEKIAEHPELAFAQDGLDQLNRSLVELNNGKQHQPIYKVRTYEPKGNKFNVGVGGNKKDKFVEAAKGTNLYFAIYTDEAGKRNYSTVPLNEVIELQKQGLPPVPEFNALGNKLLLYLSPNDLVYVPDAEEKATFYSFDSANADYAKIYKIVSFTGNRLYAIPCNVATSIVDKLEYTLLNKLEFSLEKISIKDVCIKLKADRIGHVSLA